MLDAQILSACMADRSAYESIKDYIGDKDFSPGPAFWFKLLRGYYARDTHISRVEPDVLREQGRQAITNPKHADALLAVFDALSSVSVPNVIECVLNLRRTNVALEFASAVSGGSDKKKANELFTELSTLWGQTELVQKSEIIYAKEWAELDSVIGKERRISLGIPSLDSRVGGGVLPGHHVLLFGRTEVGKSCLAITLAANMVRNSQRVLYVGNEDEINILKSRMRASLLKWDSRQIESMPKKATRLLTEMVADRLTMVHLHPGSISELSDLVEKHAPSVLVVDQIRGLTGPEDGMTQRMEQNAIKLRSLLSKHALVGISVTQAGDRSQGHNSDGPLYLSAGDVDSSRVGLPGTVDLQIGVGASAEMLSRGLRMLSFAKNKLSAAPGSREPLVVRFDLERSLVTEG